MQITAPLTLLSSALLVSLPAVASAGPLPTPPAGFAVTAFATGLDFPLGMVELADQSLLVATAAAPSPGGGGTYFERPGQLLRLVDTDGDGVADGVPQVVASGLPSALTSMERRGDLLFVTSAATRAIEVLRLSGTGPTTAAARIDAFRMRFPAAWEHGTNALAIAPVASDPNATDVYFNVGSRANSRDSVASDGLVEVVDASGVRAAVLTPDAVHRVRVTDGGAAGVTFSAPTLIATGLRNAAGLAIHPVSGDLWMQDNGIDGLEPGKRGEAFSADEINRVAAGDLGANVPDFGFADTYTRYRDGVAVGSTGTAPLVAFTADPGDPENEGAVEIAFAPASFGPGYADGLFVAFYGEANRGGTDNKENPLAFADPGTGGFFPFLGVDEESLGHPSGLLATSDTLYLSDLNTAGGLSTGGGGVIYRIVAIPEPATAALLLGVAAPLLRRRRA